jgi:hypothetical protein
MKYMDDKREDYCYVFLRKKGLETNYAAENSNWSLHEFRDKPPTTGLLLFLNKQGQQIRERIQHAELQRADGLVVTEYACNKTSDQCRDYKQKYHIVISNAMGNIICFVFSDYGSNNNHFTMTLNAGQEEELIPWFD